MSFLKFAAGIALTASVCTTAAQAATLEVVSGPDATRQITVSSFDPVGQSFTAFTDNITSLGFQFGTLNAGSANSDITLSLYAGETLTGSSLFTTVFTLPDSIQARGDLAWIDFSLPDLEVTNGALYTAVFTATSSRAALVTGPDYNVSTGEFGGGDAYVDGQLLTNASYIYSNCQGADNNCDLNFRVTGSVVPEPASWAMMILGLGFAGASLRRRKPAFTFA